MFRKSVLHFLSVALLLSMAGPAFTQIIIPNFPGVRPTPIPNMDGLPPAMRKQLEELFRKAGIQPQLAVPFNDGLIKWGGVRLKKVDSNLQQQLGLEEKEGLLVVGVSANSPAEKAGLSTGDVLVKVNDKSVPNDIDSFTKLVKDQKVEVAADLVVVRKGKEETLKAAKMPVLVRTDLIPAGPIVAPPLLFPRIDINPLLRPNPLNFFQPAGIDKLHLEMTVAGAKVVRKQDGDQFSGEYTKGDVKIIVNGKIANGRAKPDDVTITEGNQTKKYAKARDVPAQHRQVIEQLLRSPLSGLMMFPAIPNPVDLGNFPD